MAVESNGPKLVISSWALTVISAVFLLLRYYCKVKSRRVIWWDEYILTAAWICNLLQACIISPAVAKGFGKHGQDIDPANFASMSLLFSISGIFSILGIALSKTSFAVTLLRIGRGWLRVLLWFVIASMNVLFTVNIFFIFVRCSPASRTWDHSVPGTCWDARIFPDYAIAAGAYSGAMDIFLALVPWFIIWKLQMKRKEKIGVALAMSMGFLAGVTAFIKCSHIRSLAVSDFTFAAPYLAIWSIAENAVTIVASSIPFLRVLHKDVSSRNRSDGKTTLNEGTINGWVIEERPQNEVTQSIQSSSRGTGQGILETNEIRVEYQDEKRVGV